MHNSAQPAMSRGRGHNRTTTAETLPIASKIKKSVSGISHTKWRLIQ